MLRTHTYLLGLVLLALGVVVVLMVVGVVPAQRSSVLGALIAGEPPRSSRAGARVTPIDGPIAFDGLRPGVTDAFGLREGLVIVHAQYDGIAEPFSAFLRALNDPQPETISTDQHHPAAGPPGRRLRPGDQGRALCPHRRARRRRVGGHDFAAVLTDWRRRRAPHPRVG